MPFVGRRRELDRLDTVVGAPAGAGTVVLISGEPGVGKTALAGEVARRAAARGVEVRRAGCYEGEWQPPYRLWADLLGDPTLGGALDAGAPPLGADDERRRLFDTVVAGLVRDASARPALLVLDDLQWADADSLALFRRVARATRDAPLVVVATHRSTELGGLADVLPFVVREADPERIALTGLTREEVREYLGDVPGALADVIHSETGGNPFFVREVMSHLVEEAKIARRGGRWTSEASIAELGIPDGVRHVVRHRLDRLSPTSRDLLGIASVFATGIDPGLVAAVSGRPDAEVLDGLDSAAAAGLLAATGRPRAPFDFAHAIVRHAVYDDLGAARRRDLHQRAAAALEGQPESPARTAELAAQYFRAGSPDALPHCLAAAENARDQHAHLLAVRFLRMAGEVSVDPAAVAARLAVAEAEALLLDDAAATAASALDRLLVDDLATVARLLKENGAPPPAWVPLVQRGLALVGEQRDLAWARLALLVSPMAPFDEGGVHAGRWLGHDPEAVAVVERDGTEDDQARAVEAWDWRTLDDTRQLLERGRSWRSPAAVLRAYEAANRSLLFRHGDLHGAEQMMLELLELGRRWGSAAAQGEALTQLALCHALMARFADADGELAQAAAIIEPLGSLHRQHLAVSVSHAILVAYLRNQPGVPWAELAERAARLVRQPLVSRAAPLGLITAGLGALAYAMAGDAAASASLVDPLTTLLERAGEREYGATGSAWLAVAACFQLRRSDLVARHRSLVDRYERAGLVAGPFTCWSLVLARLADLAGDPPAAVADLFATARAELEAAGQLALAGRAEERAAPHPPAAPSPLTAREAEVLALLAAGHTNAEIAERIHVSVPTVNRHVANVYLKIGARNRASATAYAVSHGLLTT